MRTNIRGHQVTTRGERDAARRTVQAANRARHHRHNIAAATTWRQRVARIAGWLVAELAQLPATERDQVIRTLRASAASLNERNSR